MKTAARSEVLRPPDGISIPDARLDATVIHPPRELDCSTAPELVNRFGGSLRTNRAGAFEIPLDGVEFIDAAGLRALIDCHKLALRSRRALTFTNASPAVQRLARLVGDHAPPIQFANVVEG